MATAITSDVLMKFLTDDLGIEDALDEDTKLFSSALIDSFQMMQLVEFIEKRCGFRVPADDVTLANLDSVANILRYSGERAAAT